MALHWCAMDTQRQAVLHLVEQAFFVFAACGRITDDADNVPGGELCLRQIAHMPEDPADG